MLVQPQKPTNKVNTITLKIGDKILDRVNSHKYSGVLINSELSWVPHIRVITSKFASACGTLFKVYKTLLRYRDVPQGILLRLIE